MPYLPTSQSYLEQSSLLLQAYPDTRITTKYTFPRPTPTTTETTPAAPAAAASEPKPRIATLELKTFHPGTGICLKYKTNKGAEVGRLIMSLGKLAAGADVEGLGLGGNSSLQGSGAREGDVEMGDQSQSQSQGQNGEGEGNIGAGGKGGKGGKKKGGKGKR